MQALEEWVKKQEGSGRNEVRAMKQSEVVATFREVLTRGGLLRSSAWRDLDHLFAAFLPDFERKLREENTLSETEWQICQLQKLDFTTNEIALLTNKAKNTVSSISKRLYVRYTQQDGGAREWRDYLKNV